MRRYGMITALLYDVLSLEHPLYRRGRRTAVEGLRLEPGAHVLVLGCGTGLDLPLVARRIGPTGRIVAVDASAVMLRRAGARALDALGRRRADWPPVRFVQADAARATALLPPGERPVDAVLAVHVLSLIPDWRAAWRRAVAAARPGARVAVADVGHPDAGHGALRLWTRLISAVGGGRPDARPWRIVVQECADVQAVSLRDGHVQVRAGTLL